MSDNLRGQLIRLAHANPHLRADLLPLLGKQARSAPTVVEDEDDRKAWIQDLKRPISSKADLIKALDGTDGITHVRLTDLVWAEFRPAIQSALKSLAVGRAWDTEEVEAVEKAFKALLQDQKRILAEAKGTDYEMTQKLVFARIKKIVAIVTPWIEKSRESWG